jgi:hypothetical protein
MESVIVVAPNGYDAHLKARLANSWAVVEGAGGAWVIVDGPNRVYVSRNDSVRNEWESERLERITGTIQEPTFYTVDFSDLGLGRRVLSSCVDDPNLLVDNDHGVVLSGSEFVRVLRSQVDWDWRDDVPPRRG